MSHHKYNYESVGTINTTPILEKNVRPTYQKISLMIDEN